jgi:hypothetical protein
MTGLALRFRNESLLIYLLTAIGLTLGGSSTDLIINNWVLNVSRLDVLYGMFNIRTCIVLSTNKCCGNSNTFCETRCQGTKSSELNAF